jgi:hypothetical protein
MKLWEYDRRPAQRYTSAASSSTVCSVPKSMPWPLTSPSTTTLVAWPRMRGPLTVSATLTIARSSTAATRNRSRRIRLNSRFTATMKFSDFSTGIPTPKRVPLFTAVR